MRIAAWLVAVAVVSALIRGAVRLARRERQDEEDRARRVRLMNEYAAPDFAVEEYRVVPTAQVEARPVPREEGLEIQSRYRDEVSR